MMFNNSNLNVQAGKRSMAMFKKVNKSRHGQDRVDGKCLLRPNNAAYKAVEVGGLYRRGLMRDRCVVNRLGKKLSGKQTWVWL